jgi:CRISPR-associated protein Cmr1
MFTCFNNYQVVSKGYAMNREYSLVALTDIWTGDAKGNNTSLKTTGLLGSIRWWFEVLVRGLDGFACDPSESVCNGKDHCVVCELFGCTGWARKFRFSVLEDSRKIRKEPIKQGNRFIFCFQSFRLVRQEEWMLLDATLRLISKHGAIGGKTVFKPTDENTRSSQKHHKDFGIIEIEHYPDTLPIQNNFPSCVRSYVGQSCWKKSIGSSWASLDNFWFVDAKYLTRENTDHSSFNKVLGRKESKRCKKCRQVHDPKQKCDVTKKHPLRYSEDFSSINRWLAGDRGESKKVFSFKNPARTFGFVKEGEVDFVEMKTKLHEVWSDFVESNFLYGSGISETLLEKENQT